MLEPLDVNWVILYFVYGQVFFIMGLAIALQLRERRSQLELARSLPWLAGFGIAHGLTEWGYIFIPLQARYFPASLVTLSQIAHLVLLAFSFFCLLQFGLRIAFSPRPSRPWLRWLPATVFLMWGSGLLVGGMFAFIISWGQYVLTLLIGSGRVVTLPVLLFSFAGSGNNAVTAALSLLFVAPSILILLFTSRYLTGESTVMQGVR